MASPGRDIAEKLNVLFRRSVGLLQLTIAAGRVACTSAGSGSLLAAVTSWWCGTEVE